MGQGNPRFWRLCKCSMDGQHAVGKRLLNSPSQGYGSLIELASEAVEIAAVLEFGPFPIRGGTGFLLSIVIASRPC